MVERRNKEVEALWKIARLASQTADMERILAVLAEETAKALKGDASSVRLLREKDNLELTAGYNLSEEYKKSIPLKMGEGLVGKVAQQKRILFSDDISKDSRILYPEIGKKEKIVSLVCAPLLRKEKVMGTLAVYTRKPRVFSRGEIRLLGVLAEQAALVVERATLLDELKEKTIRDELTCVYSRGYFLARCREEFARASREEESVSFLFCDVNEFKAINRVQGYKEGDKVLCQVAEAMRSCVREEDVVCRYGGDEFAILLPRTGSTLAAKIAERIHKKLSLTAKVGGTYPTLSIGVVSCPEHGRSLEDILAKADTSMIFAKYHPRRKTAIWGEWEKIDVGELYIQDILPEVAYALAGVVDEKDSYTSEHSKLVSKQASLIAEKIGLNRKEIDRTRTAALLHDIGKLAIPGHILNKPGKLTEKEKKIVREHPEAAKRILKRVRGFENIVPMVRAVHERWDGKGYPDGLTGETIPIGARIIAVVDTYWALCSDRPYRKKLSQKRAIKELKNGAGSRFDPKVVQTFLDLIGAKGNE
jgi:diguanylate cyclase (GGDEF)-like protein/putative nucleotidyltransferase with HDIG domain